MENTEEDLEEPQQQQMEDQQNQSPVDEEVCFLWIFAYKLLRFIDVTSPLHFIQTDDTQK